MKLLTALLLICFLVFTINTRDIAAKLGSSFLLLATESTPISNGCKFGEHKLNGKCSANSDYCKDNSYNSTTKSCSSCVWYASHVESKNVDKYNQKTGDYCQTHWWAVILIILGIVLLIGLIIGLACQCCTKRKVEKKPLLVKNSPQKPREVIVQQPHYHYEEPQHHHH